MTDHAKPSDAVEIQLVRKFHELDTCETYYDPESLVVLARGAISALSSALTERDKTIQQSQAYVTALACKMECDSATCEEWETCEVMQGALHGLNIQLTQGPGELEKECRTLREQLAEARQALSDLAHAYTKTEQEAQNAIASALACYQHPDRKEAEDGQH